MSYLGLDLSTQSLTAIVADANLKVVLEESIRFDSELGEFHTKDGVHRHDDGKTITSPVLMWVKAVDALMIKLARAGCDFTKIQGVSGAGQQHGSVYWKRSARITLRNLNPKETLCDQLQDCFSVYDSPVWMDSSTGEQCRQLETVVGGSLQLAQITGSSAFERFTGSQIAKVYQACRETYLNCERISLVSSFLASLLLGDYAPLDLSDASGMNLLDINTKKWNDTLCNRCAPDLVARLGEALPAKTHIGTISPYMVKRYGFPVSCKLTAFTGDNPSSLVGLNTRPGDMAVSLGTSDTLLLWTPVANPHVEGHVFVNPVDENAFMTMLCFKNGSLTRQKVCDELCNGSWDTFSDALQRTAPGNGGKIGVFLHEVEILPHARGVFRFNAEDVLVNSFSTNDEEIRAVVEGQFIARNYYAIKYGYNTDVSSRVIVTGGASKNTALLQVLSDIFNAPVYTTGETSNATCLGGVYRCAKNTPDVCTLVCRPKNHAIYTPMIERYGQLEKVIKEQGDPNSS